MVISLRLEEKFVKKNEVLRKVLVVLALFCLMMMFSGCEPRQETVVVDKTSWEYVVKIEKEVLCQESGWHLPDKAVLLEEKQEIYKTQKDDKGNVIGYEYRTKYYYEIMRWEYARSVVNEGTGFFQYFGEYTLADDERVALKERNYYIHGKNQDGKDVKYELLHKEWSEVNEGDTLKLEISFWGSVKILSHKKYY